MSATTDSSRVGQTQKSNRAAMRSQLSGAAEVHGLGPCTRAQPATLRYLTLQGGVAGAQHTYPAHHRAQLEQVRSHKRLCYAVPTSKPALPAQHTRIIFKHTIQSKLDTLYLAEMSDREGLDAQALSALHTC